MQTHFSGADRTMGYYIPTVNQPGLSLPLLIDGIDYPGVQVTGVNIQSEILALMLAIMTSIPLTICTYGPEGRPTYDPGNFRCDL
jgi:hypothetical protein